jgi:hypothetical protein
VGSSSYSDARVEEWLIRNLARPWKQPGDFWVGRRRELLERRLRLCEHVPVVRRGAGSEFGLVERDWRDRERRIDHAGTRLDVRERSQLAFRCPLRHQ